MPPTPKRHLATFGNKKDFEGFNKRKHWQHFGNKKGFRMSRCFPYNLYDWYRSQLSL